MHRDLPALAKTELFERLAEGHAARIAVLTPNRRLAQALQREFDISQASRGLAAWETADILPFGAFVERCWEDALYSAGGAEVPVLLAPAGEQALWEEVIRGSRHSQSLFAAAPAATQCREAWRLVHAWRLLEKCKGPLTEDAEAFLEWAGRYERATREGRLADAARLPDVVIPFLADPAVRKPATVVLFGFDLLTPQARDFLAALAERGCAVLEAHPEARQSAVMRIELAEPKEEIATAARWARARLEARSPSPLGEGRGDGQPPRIGVVVPDLARSRSMVQRIFASVLQPDHLLPGTEAQLPFNLSLGAPLGGYPLVADALAVLALAGPPISFEHASRILRSPFVAAAEREMAVRARLDARLRERCGPTISIESLLRLAASPSAPRAPELIDRLRGLAEVRKASLFGAKGPAEWARAFSEALRAVGFPGERVLDSAEHQTLARWNELLGEFSALERVVPQLDFRAAWRRLEAMAGDTLFQPEAADVPIQVVGVLESAGLEFDHLWVTGLDDEAWPMPSRPNPFIPTQVQRTARIPQADPVSSLELDRRITQGWLGSSAEVVVSHARMKGESELAASPLIAYLQASPLDEMGLPAYASLRDVIRMAGRVETLEDARAPVLAADTLHGGTGVFRDQGACPFRGFARHRLACREFETPRPGIDARDRGSLVHEMLAAVWKSLRTKARMEAAQAPELQALLEACADEAIARVKKRGRAEALAGRFAALERARLVRIAREWLALEARRGDFEVIEVEEKHPVTFGGVTVRVKLDRLDRLAGGELAVLDYKTGKCATAAWMGVRPDEPQLPMYALGGAEPVAAVAFAQVQAGEMGFRGIGRVADLIPGVKLITKDQSRAAKQYRDWDALVQVWRRELEAIGRSFAAGDARVDPKKGEATCKTCDQQMFCRIAERAPFGAVGGGEADE